VVWARAPGLFCAAGPPSAVPGGEGAPPPPPRVPTGFHNSKCVRGELKRRKFQVKGALQLLIDRYG